MINREGKLFGKISVIDIAVVLIVVLLAVGIYVKFSGNSKVQVSSGETISCTVLVKNVRMYTINALEKGGPVYDKTTKEYIGDIVDVTYEPGLSQVNMADGTYANIVPEERYNAYVTLEFTGKVSDNGYYTATNKHLGTGTNLVMTSKYSACEGMVDSIQKK